MEDLKNVLKELIKYNSELKLKADGNTILESATRIFNTQYIQENRFQNNQILHPRGNPAQSSAPIPDYDDNTPPTGPQLFFLKNSKAKIPENLTKIQAQKLIGKIKNGEEFEKQ